MNDSGQFKKRVKGILEQFPPVSTLKSCSSMNESLGSILVWLDEAKAEIFEAMEADGILKNRKGCPKTYEKLVKWFGNPKK